MKLHSKITGEGFPLLLIHGLFGMGDNLAMIARPLSQQFQVHALDLRNHGRSPRADSMRFVDMAADLTEYMAIQGIERAHLVGHSLGGKVAMQAALNTPSAVAKLVVADIAPVTYASRGHDEIFAGIRAVKLADIASRRQAEESLGAFIDEAGVRQFILKNLYRHQDGRFDWRINVEALYDCYDQMRQAPEAEPGTVFEGETLFIRGGTSPYIQDDHWPLIQALFPRAQLAVIDGAGHWLHAEQPAEFNRLVSTFLSE